MREVPGYEIHPIDFRTAPPVDFAGRMLPLSPVYGAKPKAVPR